MKGKLFLVMAIVLLALIVASVPFMAACGPGGETGQPLRVGGSLAYTGAAAAKAVPMAHGYFDGFKMINEERGGVDGHPIDFVWYDDSYEAGKIVSVAKRLMDENVLFIMTMSSHQSETMMTLTNRAGYVCNPSYSSVRGIHPPTLLFATQPGYEDGWSALAKYYMETIWPKNSDYGKRKPRMAMHLLDNPTGQGPRFASKAQAESIGIEIVADEEHSTKTISETESLTRIKAKNPDCLVIASTVGATATIVKNVLELGMYPGMDVLLVQPSFDKHIVEICGADKVEGMYGVYGTVMWTDTNAGMAKMQEYAKANSPDHFGKNDYCLCWSHALITAEVLRVALDNVGYDGLNSETIRTEGFRKVKDFDPEGFMGKAGWTDDYDRRGTKSLKIYQIQGGEFVPVSDWIPTPIVKYEDYDWFQK